MGETKNSSVVLNVGSSVTTAEISRTCSGEDIFQVYSDPTYSVLRVHIILSMCIVIHNTFENTVHLQK